jgi:hypothetical protein
MTVLALELVLTSDTPAVLALCLAMTIALLWYVFSVPQAVTGAPEKTRLMYLRERKDVVYDNLRDLNFEYNAGKFPEADYRQMRTSLEDEAAALLAEIDRLESSSAEASVSSATSMFKSYSGNGERETGNGQKGNDQKGSPS